MTILLNDKFLDQNFAKAKKKVMGVSKHYSDCNFQFSIKPIDACACFCYQKQIFKIGMERQEELFYGADREPKK